MKFKKDFSGTWILGSSQLLNNSEQLNRGSSKQKTSQQKNESLLLCLSQRGESGCSKIGLGKLGVTKRGEVVSKEREVFGGNRNSAHSSSPSTSSAGEDVSVDANHGRKNEVQPVARSRTTTSAFSTSSTNRNNTQIAKKSATSSHVATPSTVPTETSASETGNGGMNFLRNNFPFFRSSTSRSRSQSVISDVSRSSETGDSKREKDKSYRRKSHLNRAFTDEPVPDTNYTYDATPKSSKPTSQDPSSLESSAVEEIRGNNKPSVKLHPAIPSVLTSSKPDNNQSPNKSISRNNSYSQNESIPSPLPTNSHKSSPVVKKDSFSDAEGVSFIKKMLQKESDRDRAAAAAAGSTGMKQNPQSGSGPSAVNGNGSAVGYNIKKSPSAGNQSYWSKFSSSQSAFLRKLFDKPKASDSPVNLNKTVQKTSSSANCTQSVENCIDEKNSSEKENAEPVLAFTVAQKASYFMKLEHEQRFSKWRKNSVDLGIISNASGESPRLNTNSSKSINEVRSKSRYLTRPVTPSEGGNATVSNNHSANLEQNIEFGSLPRIWGNNFQQMGNNAVDSLEKINETNPSTIPKSSCTDNGDKHRLELQSNGNSSEFNEISTRNLEAIPYAIEPITPAVKSFSLTRSSRLTGIADKNHQNNLGSFPMYHSASAIINTTTTPSSCSLGKHSGMKPSMKFHKNLGSAYSSSSSSFSEAMSRHESTKYLPPTTNSGFENHHDSSFGYNDRRGSASDLEMSGAANNSSPVTSRSDKVKSMFISRNRYCEPDNLSEDGEVSSGGQEVAEIICRSYENSPVFRKKNWRAQKHFQSNFTKEIWRRCGNYENWNQRTQPQQPNQRKPLQHPLPQTFTTTTNVIEVSTIPPLPAVAASPPPATSNLLQILTVLSSSNDELNEPKAKSKKHRQGSREKVSGASSIPPIHPNHTLVHSRANTATCHNSIPKNCGSLSDNHRHTMPPSSPLADSDEIFVTVPHPEDEAFQSFFCSVKSYTQVTHYPPVNGVIVAGSYNDQAEQQGFEANNTVASTDGTQTQMSDGETFDISSVQRESDLLVMKKNVPTCKRKSAGGKYKNPLRALAARMDFRQQGYTQTHPTNSNMVQCSSDVDVST